jgi:isopentenyldiphosphate isomerase
MSLLQIVSDLDSFPYDKVPEELFSFYSHDKKQIIGYITPFIASFLKEFPQVFDINNKVITIHPSLSTIELRNKALNSVAAELKTLEKIDSLRGWRDELYTVYYPPHEPYMMLERAFCPLLGVVMYGIHVNGYIPPEISRSGQYEFWVPRRSLSKPTFPGMLDNTIAGGLGYPYGVMETVVKESYEEAGIAKEYIEKNIKSVGTISYYYCVRPGEYDEDDCFTQPEFQYIYDLKFDNETIPVPVDMEAEQFFLMTLDEALTELRKGKFKPNCAVVFINFLIRNGIITAENETDYIQIVERCHRKLPFPLK